MSTSRLATCPVCEQPYGLDEATCPECGWELHGPYVLGPITPDVQLRYERDLAQARLIYREARLTQERDQAWARIAELEAELAHVQQLSPLSAVMGSPTNQPAAAINQLLQPDQTVHTTTSGTPCVVEQLITGGQGDIYWARLAGQPVVLKWYYPHQASDTQRQMLEELIRIGSPAPCFLWPIELAEEPGVAGAGCILPVRPSRLRGLADFLMQRMKPSFATLTIAGRTLADGFLQLHARGLCYHNLSFETIFFDPQTGEVLIGDTEGRVRFWDQPVRGYANPRFMAPEVVRGESLPNSTTDLFSLAVLLFSMFMLQHPLEGKKERDIDLVDLEAIHRLYGTEPVFIFDPDNDTNRPVPGLHDHALIYWAIYPTFFKKLFVQAFTQGLHNPHERVRESIWHQALIRLHDVLIACPACGAENFYDGERLQQTGGTLAPCWVCQQPVPLPPRIRLGREVVMLNHDTRLYPHHIDPNRRFDFSHPVAEITRHPSDPTIWGLQNVSTERWVAIPARGSSYDVLPGRTITLASGTRIQFGTTEGEIRV